MRRMWCGLSRCTRYLAATQREPSCTCGCSRQLWVPARLSVLPLPLLSCPHTPPTPSTPSVGRACVYARTWLSLIRPHTRRAASLSALETCSPERVGSGLVTVLVVCTRDSCMILHVEHGALLELHMFGERDAARARTAVSPSGRPAHSPRVTAQCGRIASGGEQPVWQGPLRCRQG